MPEIHDTSQYDEFKTPGLFTILNMNGGTALDLYESKPEAGTKVIGYQATGNSNQKWQIADVGESKFILICKTTGSYVTVDDEGGAVLSAVGNPDDRKVHWKIQKPDAKNPEITEFVSVALLGNVLELKNGSSVNGTQVRAWSQTDSHTGQKWVLKRLN